VIFMRIAGTLSSILGASCLVAFATAAPAQAAQKPCCYTNGEYFNSTPSTCTNYGGRVVQQRYCRSGRPAYRSDGPSFSIQLGNVVIAYSDGYYDRDRRWHRWRNDGERNWYRQNHRASYYQTTRDRDRDRKRRDWRDGRRNDWR
jgi:hypothetical protein